MRKAVALHSETRAYYRGHIPPLPWMRANSVWHNLAYRAVPWNEKSFWRRHLAIGSLVRDPGAESASDREIELTS